LGCRPDELWKLRTKSEILVGIFAGILGIDIRSQGEWDMQ
jgi:hypothetical protein